MTIFFVRELKLPKVGRLVAFGDINDVSMRVTRASSLSAHREAGLCGELRRGSGWVRTLAKARQWLRSSGPQASKEALDSQAGSSHAVFFDPCSSTSSASVRLSARYVDGLPGIWKSAQEGAAFLLQGQSARNGIREV